MKKMAMAVLLLAAPASAWAGSLDLSLSNQTANLIYSFNEDVLNPQQAAMPAGGSELTLGLFYNESSENMVYGTLMARGYRQSTNSQYQVSAGMRLLGGSLAVVEESDRRTEDETIGALALGFQAGLLLKPAQYNPVDITFEGFYAPSIASFFDAERYGEVSVRLQVEIMPRARTYIGYRRIRFDTNDYTDVALDRSAHFGLNISF